MFRRSVNSFQTEDDEEIIASRRMASRGGFRFRLPSPFMLAIVVVFVILPLVWPDGDELASAPNLIAAHRLSTDVCSLAVSADGRIMAASCRDESVLLGPRSADGRWSPSWLPKHPKGGTRSLSFSPGGEILAAGNFDGTISLWDAGSGIPAETLETGADIVSALTFSPDGSTLAAGSSDSRILLWDVARRRLREKIEGHAGSINVLSFSPDGRYLASGGEDQTIRLFDLQHPRKSMVLRGHPDIILTLAFSHDGRILASSSLRDREIRMWHVATGESREGIDFPAASNLVTCLEFSPDGHTLLIGTDHGTVYFRNVSGQREKGSLEAHVGWVKSLALVGDGKTLVTSGNDGFIRGWDVEKFSAR
jgi:WD40 repeat protein